jgi:tripartite-type tricarboxylate transporter receptor subunit TctC
MVFLTRKDLGVSSVDELVALARRSGDKPLTYGSVGVESLYHLIVEDVQQRTGAKVVHVPYKGNAPLLQDIVSGQVDFAVLEVNEVAAKELSGCVHELAVVPHATHLFEEPGTLEEVARLAARWFGRYLKAG